MDEDSKYINELMDIGYATDCFLYGTLKNEWVILIGGNTQKLRALYVIEKKSFFLVYV